MAITASLIGNASGAAALQASDAITGNTSAVIKLLQGVTYSGNLLEYIPQFVIGVANPTGLQVTALTTGGTLAAATYFWVITALNASGQSMASNEVTATTTGSTSSATLGWNQMLGATSYRVWRGTTSGSENVYYTTTATSFVDTGASGTSSSLPVSNTTGTTYTPTLTQTPLQVVVIVNASLTNSVTIQWTPTGGSSATISTLGPNSGILLFGSQATVGLTPNAGITAFTLTASTQGTPVAWVGIP